MMHLAAHLPWPRVKALADGGAVALVPIGSTEAHGPHLPLNVDVVIAEEVCRRASALVAGAFDTLVFPAVAYSLTDFAAPFAGTVSLSADAARALLTGVLEGLARSGFTRLAVVNKEPKRFPPEPIRSPGMMVANAAIRRKDDLEDAARRVDPLTGFVARLPRRLGFKLGPR